MDPNSRETQTFVVANTIMSLALAVPFGIFAYWSLRLLWRFRLQYFLLMSGLGIFSYFATPFSTGYYAGELIHCLEGSCFTGPAAMKRLHEFGAIYKNSPEDYEVYLEMVESRTEK